MLSWVDEASWIAASKDFPACQFVTVAMDQVEFRHSVREGAIIRISSKKSRVGETSVTYQVKVFNDKEDSGKVLFTTQVTFVRVDESGQKLHLS